VKEQRNLTSRIQAKPGKSTEEQELKSESSSEKDLTRKLERYNLPALQIIHAWKKDDPGYPVAMVLNMRALEELENRKSGISKFLYEKYGIADPLKFLSPNGRIMKILKNLMALPYTPDMIPAAHTALISIYFQVCTSNWEANMP
jgi:hypothetical protein